MSLKIILEDDASTADLVTPRDRLWLTIDRKRLVADGDPEAAFLYCSGSKPVLREEFEDLVEASQPKPKPKPKAPAKSKAKSKKPSSNKAAKPSDDK